MQSKLILIVNGEPNSIFSEIFIRSLNKIKIRKPIAYIYSKKLLTLQMRKLKLKKKIKLINPFKLGQYKLNNNTINLIDIECNQKKPFRYLWW